MEMKALLIHNTIQWVAIFTGFQLYIRSNGVRFSALIGSNRFAVVFGCLAGAAIGNKAVHWIHRADQWAVLADSPWQFLQGQSIVGGLIGGLIGVEIGKKIAGIRHSTGDHFVVPILVGLAIGRIGCFLAGLQDDTYGIATSLPWGVDFGDGIHRHPTQLYDIVFALVALLLLSRKAPVLSQVQGLQFKLLLSSYILWRLAIDGLKPVPFEYIAGLSGIQLVCTVFLLFYLPLVFRHLSGLRKWQES